MAGGCRAISLISITNSCKKTFSKHLLCCRQQNVYLEPVKCLATCRNYSEPAELLSSKCAASSARMKRKPMSLSIMQYGSDEALNGSLYDHRSTDYILRTTLLNGGIFSKNCLHSFYVQPNSFLASGLNLYYNSQLSQYHSWTKSSHLQSTTQLQKENYHRKEHWRNFKSSSSPTESTAVDKETKSELRDRKIPKAQTLGRLFSLAKPEAWTLTGSIGLLFISSSVTMSVPFIIGTLIDTIYISGGSGSVGALTDCLSVATSTTNAAATTVVDVATSYNPASVAAVDVATSCNPASVAVVDVATSNNTAPLTVTDVVTSDVTSGTTALSNGSVASKPGLERVCAALGAVFLVGAAANSGRVYLMTTAGQRIGQSLRSSVFSSLMRQDTGFFDTRSSGELLSRLAADTPVVATAVTTNVADGVRSAVMATTAVAMMLYTSRELALFGLSVVPPLALVAAYNSRKLRALATEVQEKLGGSTQHAEERLSNVRTVRVFAQETREMRRQDELLSQTLGVMYQEAKMRAAFFGLTGLMGNMIILSVLYKGNSLVTDELLTIGHLSSFLMYAAYVGISVSGLSSAYAELIRGAGAADRLFELLDRPSSMPLHGGQLLAAEAVRGELLFRDIHFSYPTRPHAPVFAGFDLAVPQGGVVAVVGASGCGKSTVLSLLLRLYDPQRGAVLLDGADITTLDPASLRAAIGVVSQEPVLFNGSIRENVLYGTSDPDSVPDSRIEEAAHQANALSFIRNFPQGLSTVVGERGVLLSGGQKQRLAIARALITDPRILCLDEATSALDSESEHLVQEAIERLMRGRTVLTIAHRLSTIRSADQIAVLQGGMVAELGTYSELLERQDGIFRRLVSKQSLAASRQ